MDGVVVLEPQDIGGDLSSEELVSTVSDPNQKNILLKVLNNLSQMDMEQLKNELKKVVSMKNLKEQQTPYFERTTEIGGIQVPTAVVHGSLGLLAIAILTKMIKGLGNIQSNSGSRRRRSRISSRAQGCQGGAARARLQRMKRRRESWREFLRKVGLR